MDAVELAGIAGRHLRLRLSDGQAARRPRLREVEVQGAEPRPLLRHTVTARAPSPDRDGHRFAAGLVGYDFHIVHIGIFAGVGHLATELQSELADAGQFNRHRVPRVLGIDIASEDRLLRPA